jgi:flotillin
MSTATILSIAIPVGIIILAIAAVVILGKVMYKKAPPNVAMVITGPRGSRTIVGQGAFVIPILQRVDYMSLENIQADFTSRAEIPTKDAIDIFVDAIANVSIAKDPELMKIAASKFLGYKPEQIRDIIIPVLEGNLREIISQTPLKELIQGDKKVFADRVIENVTPNLNDMGLELTTFNIQSFKDKKGIIANLGIENTVQISKDAAIAKANAEREIAVAQAQAEQEANEARVAAETEIAKRQNELSLQKAALKKAEDIAKAEADAAYGIQAQEQRKTAETRTAEADLAKLEKQIELEEREVAIKERKLEAEVKKEAEATKYAKQQAADAALYSTQKQSEAELFQRQKKAEAEKFEAVLAAEAEKARSEAERVAMENEAAGIKAKGEAEAAAIKAKAEAEAEGLMKKAEAMKEYGDAARQEMELETTKALYEQLPAIAEAIGKGYAGADIHLIGNDSGQLAGNIMSNITQIIEGFKGSTGFDPTALLSGLTKK